MPGVPNSSLRNVNNWFLNSNKTYIDPVPVFQNIMGQSTPVVGEVFQNTLRSMTSDIYTFTALPGSMHTFNERILYQSMALPSSLTECVSRFKANKVTLDDAYQLRYWNEQPLEETTSITGRMWRDISKAHEGRAMFQMDRMFTDTEKKYYYEEQGGYNTLLMCFSLQANWAATHLNIPNCTINGGSVPLNAHTAPAACWSAVNYAKTQEIIPFEYTIQPRGTVLRA